MDDYYINVLGKINRIYFIGHYAQNEILYDKRCLKEKKLNRQDDYSIYLNKIGDIYTLGNGYRKNKS